MSVGRISRRAVVLFIASAPLASAQTSLEAARTLIGEGRYRKAAALLESVVAAEPENAAAWHELGAANNYGENYRRANEAAERAVALSPDDLRYRFGRALTRWEVGDFGGALEDHDVFLAREPSAAHALTERGAALAALGRFDEADASWARSLEAHPDYVWAHYYRGQALMVRGRHGEAAADFARVLTREDFYPAHLWNWAAHRRAGLVAVELPPHDAWPGPIGSHLRGDMSADELELAAQEARLEIDERRLVSARFFAAQRLLAQGDVETARATLTRALAPATPNLPERAAASEELARLG